MKVFSQPRTKKRTTCYMPSGMILSIRESMELNGYNLKEQSKWISDAVLNLEKLDNYFEFIEQGTIDAVFDKTPDVTLSIKASIALDNMLKVVSENTAITKDIQSQIIRTAVVHFLAKDMS